MPIYLDHTIVPATDKEASARFARNRLAPPLIAAGRRARLDSRDVLRSQLPRRLALSSPTTAKRVAFAVAALVQWPGAY